MKADHIAKKNNNRSYMQKESFDNFKANMYTIIEKRQLIFPQLTNAYINQKKYKKKYEKMSILSDITKKNYNDCAKRLNLDELARIYALDIRKKRISCTKKRTLCNKF